MTVVSPQDPWYQVSDVVRLIRNKQAQTRPEVADASRLGRNVVTQRIQAAADLHLIEPDGTGRSRGGRAADVWRFRPEAGHVLIGLVGVTRFRVLITDLAGDIRAQRTVEWPNMEGPEATCGRMADVWDDLLASEGLGAPWGVCIGMPAPVDFSTGRSADPVDHVDTHRWPRSFDVRAWFRDRFQAPAWTDSIANLMAIGSAVARSGSQDLIYLRLGTGIGGGVVSDGVLHRGATWLAGEFAHVTVADDEDRVCLCGRVGCLDTYAGGWALVRDAQAAAATGRSPFLAVIADERELTTDDLVAGSRHGDPASIEILRRAAEAVGEVIASAATWFNPARVVIGGFAFAREPLFLSVVERTVHLRALSAIAQTLEVVPGDEHQNEAVLGAADIVTRTLMSPAYLVEWGPLGSPVHAQAIRTHERQD